MSVVLGIKKGNCVYLGADTRTSTGCHCKSYLQKANFKIDKRKDGILLAHTGSVRISQEFTRIFDKLISLENGKTLTKKELVTKLMPSVRKSFFDKELFDKDEVTVDFRAIIAHKDCMYLIESDLSVWKSDACAIGCGDTSAIPFIIDKDGEPNESILKGLEYASESTNYIGAPFVLIDTVNLEYKICE